MLFMAAILSDKCDRDQGQKEQDIASHTEKLGWFWQAFSVRHDRAQFAPWRCALRSETRPRNKKGACRFVPIILHAVKLRHCEEQSDEAIHLSAGGGMDSLAGPSSGAHSPDAKRRGPIRQPDGQISSGFQKLCQAPK